MIRVTREFKAEYGTRYRERVNFAINLRLHLCAGVILICYTVLTSPKKGETAVQGCNPTLSVSVVLVSRKVNFLRSISLAVFVFWLFLADKVSSRSYVNLQHYRWRSFAYFTSTLSLKSSHKCQFSLLMCPHSNIRW